MRVTFSIDPKNMKEIMKITGEKSRSKAVNKAVEEYLRRYYLKKLLDLQGKLDLDLDDWYEFRHRALIT